MAKHDRGHDIRKGPSAKSLIKGACPNIWISPRRGEAFESNVLNIQCATNWFNTLAEEFKTCRLPRVEGLDNTFNMRIYQQSMFANGCVVVFEKGGKLYCLPGLGAGNINVNGDPLNAYIHGYNGYTDEVDVYVAGSDEEEEDFLTNGIAGKQKSPEKARAFILWENESRVPFVNITLEYSGKIANASRTLDTTIDDMANPRMLMGATAEAVAAIQDYQRRRNNHESTIDLSVDLSKVNGLTVKDMVDVVEFQTNAQNVPVLTENVEWLLAQYRQREYLNGHMTIDKKAQVSVPEFESDSDSVKTMNKSYKNFHEWQWEVINKHFGRNAKLVWADAQVDEEQEKEVKDNERNEDTGNIH